MVKTILTNTGGAITVSNKNDELSVPSNKAPDFAKLLTTESATGTFAKVKEKYLETFADGDTVEVSIEDAVHNFALPIAEELTFSGSPINVDVDINESTEEYWRNMAWDFDDQGAFVFPKSGFYDYGKGTYESTTDYTKLRFWHVDESLDADLFTSWNTVASVVDPATSKRKVLTFSSSDTNTKKLRMVSDNFSIFNFNKVYNLKFKYETTEPTTGGTVSALQFQIVDAKNYDDVLFYVDIPFTGSGDIDIELPEGVFNRPVRFAFYIEYVGAPGPATGTVAIEGLYIYDTTTPNRIIKLYNLTEKTLLSPVGGAEIDFSSISGDIEISSIQITDGLQSPDGINVAVSKDGKLWFSYENGEWKLVNDLTAFNMTPASLAALGRDELAFLMKDNDEKKLWFIFKPASMDYPGGMSISEITATFREAPLATSIPTTQVSSEIKVRKYVRFTNNSGGTLNNVVLAVLYI